MIFKIQRACEAKYFRHCVTGEIHYGDYYEIPYHYHVVDDALRSAKDKRYGINKGIRHIDHVWKGQPGPKPFQGIEVDNDGMVEIDSVVELCQIIESERHPIIVARAADNSGVGHDPNGTWTLTIYNTFVE